MSAGEKASELAASMSLQSLKIIDRGGRSIVDAFSSEAPGRSGGEDLSGDGFIKEIIDGKSLSTLASRNGDGLMIRAGSPISLNGRIIGALVSEFPLDSAFIDNINRITNLQMSVYYGSTVVASTEFDHSSANRIGTKETNADVVQKVLRGGQFVTVPVFIGSKPYVASYMPILDYQNKVIGMTSVAKSQHDILDMSNQTNRLTLITMLVIMLILVAPFYMLTKRLSAEIH